MHVVFAKPLSALNATAATTVRITAVISTGAIAAVAMTAASVAHASGTAFNFLSHSRGAQSVPTMGTSTLSNPTPQRINTDAVAGTTVSTTVSATASTTATTTAYPTTRTNTGNNNTGNNNTGNNNAGTTANQDNTVTPSDAAKSSDPKQAEPPKPIEPKKVLYYTYGLKIKGSDIGGADQAYKLRPVIGLRYGRLRIGANADPESWIGIDATRREPTLSYDVSTNPRLSALVGLRLQNISTGEAFNALDSGRHTVRGRLQLNYRLTPRWTLGTELTQDLLGRGDGTTITVGAARSWNPSTRDVLSVGVNTTWANATHWRTPYLDPASTAVTRSLRLGTLTQAQNLSAGFGNIGIGVHYRRELAKNLVWVSTVSAGQPIGQISDIAGSRTSYGAETGLLWFGKR